MLLSLNQRVSFTPEIITVTIGDPIEGIIVSENATEFGIETADGTIVRAEKRLCKVLHD